ncbi:MAG TPA: OmpA family protein [Caulobacteraceae bacterium]|nr:OmpA family protein [Caulobacteraceae bacterium]
MRTHAFPLVAALVAAALPVAASAHARAANNHHRHRHVASEAARALMATHETVSFDSDSFTLTPEAMRSLDRFAHQLKPAAHEVRIEAVGYADATGTDPHNLLLAERRATAVLHYLHARGGVSLLRMSAASYGEGMPVTSNETSGGRAANRRVVIVVMPWRPAPRVA